ncbi:pantoate--beta-alanine ligase [Chitinophaga defluvii]|uniref:Pantothenate synthetase n=1 Tax=Chitinophaga defluvii TaxID=3163343 RepID=A0ABV2T304_9BACT
MYLFKRRNDLRHHLEQAKLKGQTIGFVPTMGALHDGHLSLVAAAKEKCDIVVCSIFVNPTQFNDPKDFEKYPITIEQDIVKLTDAGTDVLFLPSVAEMYPEGLASGKHYDFGNLEKVLEGEFRAGHFQGVGRVVHKLLDIVMPHQLFMGQKDFQQCLIIKELIHLLALPVQLVVCPTRREADGLAMSSRNVRLNAAHRQQATDIFKVLTAIRDQFGKVPNSTLSKEAMTQLKKDGFEPEYVEIITLRNGQVTREDAPSADKTVAVVLAAWLGGVRLIDNMILQGQL